ncbi:hypothetical protein LOZ39_003849 [Ophidiomyces ophidiicola]|nr:hypothetical protein LOZ49_002571 [Ophidiomyces ophidiicola]KAI2074024.1 hypothetical protein LOZ39_003849 [Ophidiomyces ophidiicola]KAI2134852.1 hypothetical protein LOZ29_004110 [Ophidiomyces ophidiicola]KAI2138451.1 hypothetical protein LOZ28_003538 [Ophidiomyces ophidiicola]KAI2217723.1 hypothetical protein LOZ15_003585 [Ophidiomyces ophidiicola]
MAAVTVDEFRATLEAAINRRKCRYSNFFAFHFRWADDNTGAERDEKSFEDMARLMGFPVVDTYVIPDGTLAPGHEVSDRIFKIFRDAETAPGESIVMIHYSGHGGPNNLNELALHSRYGKNIAMERIIGYMIPSENVDTHVDVIMILDCCYSFLASRTLKQESRVFEILTAGSNNDAAAFSAGVRNSFTSKLLVEIHSRAQAGDTFVEMADVMDTLRKTSPLKKPGYASRLGAGSATLPLFPGLASTANTSHPQEPGMLATFSLHVSKIFNNVELEDIAMWLSNMPKVKGASLKLEGIKITNSMIFIFEASCVSYYRVCGLPGVTLICENLPVNFDWLLHRGYPRARIPS